MQEEGYGRGFHNDDLGHPVYWSNSHEDTSMGKKVGGEAHNNEVYLLLKKIENKITEIHPKFNVYKEESDYPIKPVDNWLSFLKLVQEIYKERNNIS